MGYLGDFGIDNAIVIMMSIGGVAALCVSALSGEQITKSSVPVSSKAEVHLIVRFSTLTFLVLTAPVQPMSYSR